MWELTFRLCDGRHNKVGSSFIVLARTSLLSWQEDARDFCPEGAMLAIGASCFPTRVKHWVMMAVSYATGRNVEQNLGTAKDWYSKAAAQADSSAQNELGFLYENGFGTDKDVNRALEFYWVSAAGGNASAKYNLGRFTV
jgi:hypothetical protein